MKTKDRVVKKGFNSAGTILEIKEEVYVKVEWDEGYLAKERPKWCRIEELKLL